MVPHAIAQVRVDKWPPGDSFLRCQLTTKFILVSANGATFPALSQFPGLAGRAWLLVCGEGGTVRVTAGATDLTFKMAASRDGWQEALGPHQMGLPRAAGVSPSMALASVGKKTPGERRRRGCLTSCSLVLELPL